MDYYKRNKHRIWEIDFARGIAIILMISLHIKWAIDYFGIGNTGVPPMVYGVLQRFTAGTFIFLVGVSLVLSNLKVTEKKMLLKRNIIRGMNVFAYGMGITLISYIFARNAMVLFGVLHLIGLGIILATFMLKQNGLNLILGLGIVILGCYTVNIDMGWLFFLGFKYPGVETDFFPIMPWFGLTLIGVYVGNKYYIDGKTKFPLDKFPQVLEYIAFLGRHSLMIYFVHMIVILSFVFAIGKLSF